MKTTILPLKHSMKRSPLRAFLLIPFVLGCFGLSPQARAVCQEGCLPNENTVLGDDALISNTTGEWNTAIGNQALYTNTFGFGNTATGTSALYANTTGSNNTAVGFDALSNNTVGVLNTANGEQALFHNTTGGLNTATGAQSLVVNSTGNYNTATGFEALYNNTIGNYNTATGALSLLVNSTGSNNTAYGNNALLKNTTGSGNIAVGERAGRNLTTGDHNIDIGNEGVAAEANSIRIGRVGTQTNAYVAGISGATVPTGVPVIVDTAGHLGTTTSSARYKDNVQPMNEASEAILALKPVTFRYKHDLDPKGIPQFGLVAEDVEKVNPDLVARDEQGKPYTVRYDAVNAMLLNEFLKARRQIDAQQKQIDALAAGLQKVSAQLELSKATPQTVLNDQ